MKPRCFILFLIMVSNEQTSFFFLNFAAQYFKLKVKYLKVKITDIPSDIFLVFVSVCVCHGGWLWCSYCSELVWNNSSILAHVSGGRQQHSAFPALCVPARLGLGLGFHSHLELGAQECHCSSFQTRAGSDAQANTHINRHMGAHTLSTQYARAHTSQPQKLRSPCFVMLSLLT